MIQTVTAQHIKVPEDWSNTGKSIHKTRAEAEAQAQLQSRTEDLE